MDETGLLAVFTTSRAYARTHSKSPREGERQGSPEPPRREARTGKPWTPSGRARSFSRAGRRGRGLDQADNQNVYLDGTCTVSLQSDTGQ